MKHKIKTRSPFFVGIILILLGGVLAAINLNLLPAGLHKIIISWQMLLIFIGIIALCRKHLLSGMILIILGCFFIIPKLSDFIDVPERFTALYWPILLVCFGILMIMCRLFGGRTERCHHYSGKHHWHSHHCHSSSENWRHNHKQQYSEHDIDGDFHKVNVFGYGEYFVIDSEFSGGSLTAVFGGMEVDLRKAILPEGDTFLKIDAVFSGITLLIPEDWAVEPRFDVVASGIDDSRKSKAPTNNRKLILCGSAVFSGIEIQN